MSQRISSPVEILSTCWQHALLLGLPAVHEQIRDLSATKDWTMEQRKEASRGKLAYPMKTWVRRPTAQDCRVVGMFTQTWGGGQLGFGGMGTASMTEAYTVVIEGPARQHRAVYWDGELAYVVDLGKATEAQRAAFEEDLARKWTESVDKAKKRYGAKVKK